MATSQGLYSLATIIKRLEAATSRLEDIASASQPPNPTESEEGPAAIAAGALTPAPPPPPPPPPAPEQAPAPVEEDLPASVKAFDEAVIEAKIKPWVQLSKSFNLPLITEIGNLVAAEYGELRNFLVKVGKCKKPDQDQLKKLLEPISKSIEAFNKAKDTYRRERDTFGHLQYASEAAVAVGWVLNERPAQYVSDVKESSEYYGNRVIKDFKDKDARHVEWCRGLSGILDAAKEHAGEWYKTGLVWNPKGITVQELEAKPAAPPVPAPPPAPPAPTASAAPAAGGVASVFAELNRGEEVTKGLRKVDKSEMTHKNPELRAGSTVPAATPSAGKKPIRPTKPAALAGKKPPKFVLEGNKWLIENQENGAIITVDETSLSHSINIYNCINTTVVVKGKVNAVSLIRSTRTSILVDSVVSCISITASPSFAAQITGTVPMIQVDSTDSGQLYLSKDSLTAEITTAKCSAINVSLPVIGEEEGVFEEHAVPEMLKSVVIDGKLVTTVVEHVG